MIAVVKTDGWRWESKSQKNKPKIKGRLTQMSKVDLLASANILKALEVDHLYF
jgi:hypothetical protein